MNCISRNSDLVMENNSIYFSNNKNELFAIDFQSGAFKWKQNVNSSLRSTIINNLLFTISKEGYLIIVDASNGKIMRMINKNFLNIKSPQFNLLLIFMLLCIS